MVNKGLQSCAFSLSSPNLHCCLCPPGRPCLLRGCAGVLPG